MEDLVKEIKKSEFFQKIQKNPILFGLLKFVINDLIIKGAKDLLDDGKLNGSAK